MNSKETRTKKPHKFNIGEGYGIWQDCSTIHRSFPTSFYRAKSGDSAGEYKAGDSVVLYQETAPTYGCVKWDAWRRACVANKLRNTMAVAVTGSGYGVKSALIAGFPVMAIMHDHVAYQDFGGADVVADGFSAKLADEVMRMLHLEG